MARIEVCECDRCTAQYKIDPNNEMPYKVKSTVHNTKDLDAGELDLCPQCEYALEEFMDNPVLKKRAKRTNPNVWTPEAKEKHAARMRLAQGYAKEIKEHDNIPGNTAFGIASRIIKTEGLVEGDEIIKENGQWMKRKTEPEAHTYTCSVCMKEEVDVENGMCENCLSELNNKDQDKE